jgi:hypothetical protein
MRWLANWRASDRLLGIVSRVVPTADVRAALRGRSWVAQRFQRCDQQIAWSAASAAEVPRETKSESSHADGQESRARTRRNIPEPQTNA